MNMMDIVILAVLGVCMFLPISLVEYHSISVVFLCIEQIFVDIGKGLWCSFSVFDGIY